MINFPISWQIELQPKLLSIFNKLINLGVQSDQSVDLKKATRLVNVIASINLFMWAITVIVLGPAMTLPAALTAAGLILLLFLVIGINFLGFFKTARHLLVISLYLTLYISAQFFTVPKEFELSSFSFIGVPIVLFAFESVKWVIFYTLLNIGNTMLMKYGIFFVPDEWKMPIDLWGTSLPLVEGYFVNFLTTYYFFTANRNSENRLIETYAELTKKNRLSTVGKMAGGVAHEINNPLAIIITKVQLIRMKMVGTELSEPESAVAKLLADVESTAYRISGVVKSLMNYSTRSETASFDEVLLSEILSSTLDLCREQFNLANVKLEIGPIPQNLKILCQKNDISEVILNLLINALDATTELKERWVRVDFLEQDHSLSIFITDSGRTPSKIVRDKMFKPFFTTKGTGKGMGMGLNIAKDIIEAHGGEIGLDVSSQNTRIWIRLPKK